MISKEVLVTKNKINDKINSIIDFHAIWEHNHETKVCRLIIEGTYMEKGKKQSGLTEADKEWIANLVVTTVKPIQEDITSLKEDVKALKEDMVEIKNRLDVVEKDIKLIKECPTIKKELK